MNKSEISKIVLKSGYTHENTDNHLSDRWLNAFNAALLDEVTAYTPTTEAEVVNIIESIIERVSMRDNLNLMTKSEARFWKR